MEISLVANRLLNKLNVKLPGHFYSHQGTDFLRHGIKLLFEVLLIVLALSGPVPSSFRCIFG